MEKYSTVLVHHGIKGQKWGVRRYQNSDGSFTSEGRKRYGSDGTMAGGARAKIGKYDRRAAVIESKRKAALAKNEAARKKDNSYYDANPKKNYVWDEDSGETKKDFGNRYYNEKASKINAKYDTKARANTIKSEMSVGSKVARNVFLGPFANTSVARLEAKGLSSFAAHATTAVTGPLGGIIISDLLNDKKND